MSGKAVYAIVAWTPGEVEDRYVSWLDKVHIAEVLAEPGFIAARRVRLAQTDAEGRRGHMILYDVATAADLDDYLRSENRQRFIAEGQQAFPAVALMRFDGTVCHQA